VPFKAELIYKRRNPVLLPTPKDSTSAITIPESPGLYRKAFRMSFLLFRQYNSPIAPESTIAVKDLDVLASASDTFSGETSRLFVHSLYFPVHDDPIESAVHILVQVLMPLK
jgi:hypothetical protein